MRVKKNKQSKIVEDLLEHAEASYFLYKICEGCDKLLMYERSVCPNCNAYRFDTSRKRVVKELKKLVKEEAGFFESLKDF